MNMTEKEESAQLARILAQFVATMDNLDAVQEGLTMLGYNTAELRTAKEHLIVFLHALKMTMQKKREIKAYFIQKGTTLSQGILDAYNLLKELDAEGIISYKDGQLIRNK